MQSKNVVINLKNRSDYGFELTALARFKSLSLICSLVLAASMAMSLSAFNFSIYSLRIMTSSSLKSIAARSHLNSLPSAIEYSSTCSGSYCEILRFKNFNFQYWQQSPSFGPYGLYSPMRLKNSSSISFLAFFHSSLLVSRSQISSRVYLNR